MAALFALGMAAQAGDPATQIQAKLVSQLKLTKATADRSDIVTAGDVVVLQKDGLMMCSTASSYAFSNTYANGVLSANYNNRAKDAAKSYAKAFGLSRFGLGGGASVTEQAIHQLGAVGGARLQNRLEVATVVTHDGDQDVLGSNARDASLRSDLRGGHRHDVKCLRGRGLAGLGRCVHGRRWGNLTYAERLERATGFSVQP